MRNLRHTYQQLEREFARVEPALKAEETSTISLTDYKKRIWRNYVQSYHLDCLDNVLTRVAEYVETQGKSGIQNLIISMPRRYGKSTTVECFAEWYLGRNPSDRLIIASYGQELASKISRKIRNTLDLAVYQSIFPHVKLSEDSRSVSNWNISAYEGGANAMGMQGSATGFGFDLLIVDDPIRNRQDAESQLRRDRIYEELRDSIFSGANTRYAARIVIGTRWHGDDPIGRLLEREPENWLDFKLPAIVDAPYVITDFDDAVLYERQPHEPLWAYKHSLADLEAMREEAAPYSWHSLWQQEPIEAVGNIFKREWFDIITSPPEMEDVVRAWDLAMTDKDSSDYTAGVKMGKGVDGHLYILDVFHGRVDFADLVDTLVGVIIKDGYDVRHGIESAGFLSRIVEQVIADDRVFNYAVEPYTVDKDKLTRALPLTGKFQTGLIHLVRAGWNARFIDELTAFAGKGSAHDDMVDGTSAAFAMIADGFIPQGFTSW